MLLFSATLNSLAIIFGVNQKNLHCVFFLLVILLPQLNLTYFIPNLVYIFLALGNFKILANNKL